MSLGIRTKQGAPAVGVDSSRDATTNEDPFETLTPAVFPGEEAFLNLSERLGLPRKKLEEKLLSFGAELRSFGNTTKFLERLSVERGEIPNTNVYGKVAVGYRFSFEGRIDEIRRLLLDYHPSLKREGIDLLSLSPDYPTEQPNNEQQNKASVESRFYGCGCCQTVARAISLKGESRSDYVITVNAFPWDPLNEMQTALFHDSMTDRVIRNDEGLYIPQNGKTIGCKLTPAWVESVMLNANQKEAVAIQNHPASGMSAADHLHAQFFPRDLYKSAILRQVIDDFGPAPAELVVPRRSRYHPFDTLVLSCSDTAALSRAVVNVYEKLEDAHLVSTLAYLDGHCFMSVQSPQPDGYRPNDIGARVLLNCYRPEELEHWSLVQDTFYEPGDAPWERLAV